jgi:uncharacterized protein (TIGR03435 family)
MTKLASDLQGFAGRPVRNDTGLSGLFDVEVSFVPTSGLSLQPGTDDIPIFTAVQEQLGLKLEPTQGPVEVLVIDDVQRPTPD